MNKVIKVCEKCNEEFEAKKPTGMDSVDEYYWEEETRLCEKCYQKQVEESEKKPEMWDPTKWNPKMHDCGTDLNEHVKNVKGINVVDFGDSE